MATGFLVAIGLAAAAAIGIEIDYTNTKKNQKNEAFQGLQDKVKASPTLSQLTMDDLINRAADLGYITTEDKPEYLKLLKEIDDDPYGFWENLNGETTSRKNAVIDLYNRLAKATPEIDEVLNSQMNFDVRGALSSAMPNIVDPPAYQAFDTNFVSPAESLEADPLKWWGGKELAEHHDLHWDLDEMYNRVKEGTSTRLEADRFKSDQLNTGSLRNDHANEVSYLSQLRDTKSNAITSGASAGARAAGEILGMLGTTNEYSTNQADVANARWDAVQQSLLNDARAKVTANNAYMSLGNNIFDNIEYLYANDVDRRGAELNNFANMFAADQALRGSYAEANAKMAAEQAVARANVAAARSSVDDINNQYLFMFDRFYGRALENGYTGKLANAVAVNDFFNWADSQGQTYANNNMNYRQWRNSVG